MAGAEATSSAVALQIINVDEHHELALAATQCGRQVEKLSKREVEADTPYLAASDPGPQVVHHLILDDLSYSRAM